MPLARRRPARAAGRRSPCRSPASRSAAHRETSRPARGLRRRRAPTPTRRRPAAAAAAATASRSAASAAVDTSMPTPDAVRDVAEVGQQPVGDVGHRRRHRHRRPPGPARTAVRAPDGDDEARRSWRTPLCHNAYPAAERPRSPATANGSPGRAPLRSTGCTAVEVAEHSHRNHPLRGAHQVTADDACARAAGLVPHAVGQLQRLRRRRVARRAECHDKAVAARPSPRCRRRSARWPYGRCRVVWTSPGGSAGLRRACRWTPPPCRRRANTTAASSPGPSATAAG